MRRWRFPISSGRLALAALIVALGVALMPSIRQVRGVATSTVDDAAVLRQAVESAIAPDTGRGNIRLPSVRIDAGDATVIVGLRGGPDLATIRARAADDALLILNALYHSPAAGRVRTTTVVGTFSVTSARGNREWPVLRVTLSAERAGRLDWSAVTPDRLPSVVDDWWLYPPLAEGEGPVNATPMLVASPTAATPVA